MYAMLFWGDVLGVLRYCGFEGLAVLVFIWERCLGFAWLASGYLSVVFVGGGGPIFAMSVDFCGCLSAGFSHVSRVYVWGWGFGSVLVHL